LRDPQLARSLEVRERHSSGVFADRYVALDRSSGGKLLLSVPRLSPTDLDPVTRDRALQAIRRYDSLVHPHICTQLGAGVASSGHLWIAQELPDDADPSPGGSSASRAAETLTHVCEGLAYAHARGLVHGALTADAVVGADARNPRIADFGVAAALFEAGVLAELARGSSAAAPEVRAGGEPTAPADVYALGALGINGLAGGEADGSAEGPEALAVRARHIPAAGPAAVLERAVQPDPGARFRTAEEMLPQLRAVMAPRGTMRAPQRRKPSRVEAAEPPAEPEMSHREAAGLILSAVVRSAFSLLIALALLTAAVAGGLALAMRQTPGVVAVPGLEGKPAGVAINLAKERGLKGQVVREEYDRSVPTGYVIRQTPYAGKLVREGRGIDLLVSLGPPRVRVPKVTGKKLAEARELLAAAGLSAGTINREPASGEPDQVLQQAPKADAEVPVNTLVALTVAVSTERKPRSEQQDRAPRAAAVSIIVPEGPVIQRVRIEVHYPNGRYTVAYDRQHQPGDKVEAHVAAAGEATVQVLIDGELVTPEQHLAPSP